MEIYNFILKHKDFISGLVGVATLYVLYKSNIHKHIIMFWKSRIEPKMWVSAKVINSNLSEMKEMIATSIENQNKLSSAIKELHADYQEVKNMVAPNGGSSLIDLANWLYAKSIAQDFDNEAAILAQANKSGHLMNVNRMFTRVTGRTEGELIGNGWVNAIVGQDRQRVIHEWKDALAEGRDYLSEFSLSDLDGNESAVEARFSRMYDKKGNVLGYYVRMHLIG